MNQNRIPEVTHFKVYRHLPDLEVIAVDAIDNSCDYDVKDAMDPFMRLTRREDSGIWQVSMPILLPGDDERLKALISSAEISEAKTILVLMKCDDYLQSVGGSIENVGNVVFYYGGLATSTAISDGWYGFFEKHYASPHHVDRKGALKPSKSRVKVLTKENDAEKEYISMQANGVLIGHNDRIQDLIDRWDEEQKEKRTK